MPKKRGDKLLINNCECMKFIYLNCGLRNEDKSDHRNHEHYLRGVALNNQTVASDPFK